MIPVVVAGSSPISRPRPSLTCDTRPSKDGEVTRSYSPPVTMIEFEVDSQCCAFALLPLTSRFAHFPGVARRLRGNLGCPYGVSAQIVQNCSTRDYHYGCGSVRSIRVRRSNF